MTPGWPGPSDTTSLILLKDFVAQHTSGFEELKKHVAQYNPKWAGGHSGIAGKTIEGLA
jgi:anaerobic selenocysteine-containing dehydrogenase